MGYLDLMVCFFVTWCCVVLRAGIFASDFSVVCMWPSFGCRLCVAMRGPCALLVVVPWGCMARSTGSFGLLNHFLMFYVVALMFVGWFARYCQRGSLSQVFVHGDDLLAVF